MVLGLALRIFFRHIEVAGLERVPLAGATIFVLNHPNGLVDPVFLLCLAPRRVSFLAKSPLFKMPVIGYFVRALDAIPVYRKQDTGEDTRKNRETFERARALLKSGGTIAICPEGISHSKPELQPLKTGAARIALGAASSGKRALDLKIVPAGLYYTAKTSFRSDALLYFGEPLSVEPVALDADGDPSRDDVQRLSERIFEALREVTLNTKHHEALAIIDRAERIFSADDDGAEGGQTLTRELRLRQRFVEAYAELRERAPERVAALDARIRKYEEELRQAGFDDPRDLSTSTLERHAGKRRLITRFVGFLLLAPVALVGAVIHYPAYRLAGWLATRLARNPEHVRNPSEHPEKFEDVISTYKIMAAMLLFPLTWTALAVVSWAYLDWWWTALVAFVVAPLAGYCALHFREKFERFVGGTRALAFFITERGFFRQLLEERRAIRREIIALGDQAMSSKQ